MRLKIYCESSLIMDVDEAQWKAWVKRITTASDWTWGLSWNEKIVKDVITNPAKFKIMTYDSETGKEVQALESAVFDAVLNKKDEQIQELKNQLAAMEYEKNKPIPYLSSTTSTLGVRHVLND